MTDESQTQGQSEQSEQSEGLVSKLVNAAKSAGEKISDMAEEVKDKVEDAVESIAERVGLKEADDDDDRDDDDDDAAEAASEAVEATEVAETTDSETPATTASSEAPATDVSAEPAADAAEGAVFEPTSSDDDSATPRRLADLEPGMELEGRVTSTALYGVFVDIGVGRDGLVHISEMSDQRIESPTDVVQIGDTVKVRIKSVDPDARRISLTMRSPRQEGERRRRGPRRPEVDQQRMLDLKPGDLIDGTINGIAPFGVFVDIGVGKDGLVHISELSDTRVEKPEDAVTVGETRTFRVLEVDSEGQRISLSLRRAQEGYQERPKATGARRRDVNLDAVTTGQILEGTVSGIAPFGAFIDLGVGRDGLVHISELSEGRVGKVEDVVNVGDAVKVRVLEVDPSSKRISLSMRLEVPVGPVSTSGSSRLDRDWSNPASREEGAPAGPRDDRSGGRKGRRDRDDRRPAREPELYSFGGEEEETTVDNATLDDLLLKYSPDYQDTRRARSGKRHEREEDFDDEEETRESRARRDAIRRTLRDQDEF